MSSIKGKKDKQKYDRIYHKKHRKEIKEYFKQIRRICKCGRRLRMSKGSSRTRIKEGTVKKGGVNAKPSSPPPSPPKGQGGKKNLIKDGQGKLLIIIKLIKKNAIKEI